MINGRHVSSGGPSKNAHVLIVNTLSDNSAARRFVTCSINFGKRYGTRVTLVSNYQINKREVRTYSLDGQKLSTEVYLQMRE